MCIEDVRLGRKAMSGQVDLIAGLVSIPALPQSDDRFSIVLSAPIAGHITYSLENPAVIGQGINLGPGDGTTVLNVKDCGAMVKAPWFVVSDAATSPIAILFTILQEK